MTPGLVIALIAVLACAAIWLIAAYRGQRHAATAAALVVMGLVMTRACKLWVPPDAHLVAMGAVWVAVGGLILRRAIRATNTPCAVAGGALIASGMCYAVADAIGAAMALWSPAMAAADALGFAAVGALLWGAAGGSRVGADNRVAGHLLGANSGRGAGMAARAGMDTHGSQDAARSGSGRRPHAGEVA